MCTVRVLSIQSAIDSSSFSLKCLDTKDTKVDLSATDTRPTKRLSLFVCQCVFSAGKNVFSVLRTDKRPNVVKAN